MKKISLTKRLICKLIIVTLLFNQIIAAPVAYALDKVEPADPPNNTESILDLVVLVVDKKITSTGGEYEGLLTEGYESLKVSDMENRILRYADDIVDEDDDLPNSNNEFTDVQILTFDENRDSVADIAEALENLYKNGNGNNRLSGVVLIGDIPLPVVNKAGNRFVSVFPYTDFVDKAYIYNPLTLSFERNNSVDFPKQEIWHGVIRPMSEGAAGMEELATFFDKNHLYYTGEEMYGEFDRKMFFGDLVNEEKNLNEDAYKRYVQYLDALEDIAYYRYNKHWANEVMASSVADIPTNDDGSLPINLDHPGNKPVIIDGKNSEDAPSFKDAISGNPLSVMPDMYTKNIIDSNLLPYYRTFGTFISRVNDWARFTARYKLSDVHSIPGLITMKDEYAKFYAKSINDALEAQINDLAHKIQEPIPIVEYSDISGKIGSGGDAVPFELELDGLEPNMDLPPLPGISETAEGDPPSVNGFKYQFHYLNTSEEPDALFVNGIRANTINTPKLCAPFLGSTKKKYFVKNDEGKVVYNPKGYNCGDDKDNDEDGLSDEDDPQCVNEFGAFTENANEDGSEQGVYSILTRSIRTDNVSTATKTMTAGLNTRLLDKKELLTETDNKYGGATDDYGYYGTGSIIENNEEYGIPAFTHNTLFSYCEEYANPFDRKIIDEDPDNDDEDDCPQFTFKNVLQKGDVITKVNGREIGFANSFDRAIEKSYKEVVKVIRALNEPELRWLDDFKYQLVVKTPDNIFKFNTPAEILEGPFKDLMADSLIRPFTVIGVLIDIEYYRGEVKHTESFTFSLQIEMTTKVDDDGDEYLSDDIKKIFAVRGMPSNNANQLFVNLSDKGTVNISDFLKVTDAAIFSMYDNEKLGYGGGPYGISGGCNMGMAGMKGDMCLAKLATYPVLDPAGSREPQEMNIPGEGDVLQFKENVNINNKGDNSGNIMDHVFHVDQFQIPEGYEFDDIDTVYLNSCYSGLPSLNWSFLITEVANTIESILNPFADPPFTDESAGDDSSRYYFPLDFGEIEPGGALETLNTAIQVISLGLADDIDNIEIPFDDYGQLNEYFGDYIKNFHASISSLNDDDTDNDITREQFIKGQNYKGGNYDPEILYEVDEAFDLDDYALLDGSSLDPLIDIYGEINNLDASDITLNYTDSAEITLELFAKRYGLFDGKDNNDNGLTDFEWQLQPDGTYKQFFDYDEADEKYGIHNRSLDEVARRLLSHNSEYVIPYSHPFFPYRGFGVGKDGFMDDLTLTVKTNNSFEIPSVILHNEPTFFTIDSQFAAGMAHSLPIDNPRYVAFQTVGTAFPEDPSGLSTTSYYSAGDLARAEETPPGIEYINLFNEEISSYNQLVATLAAKADEIAAIPGSYRIVGGDENTDLTKIQHEIYTQYLLPVISAGSDNPFDGYNLEEGSRNKIIDLIQWLRMDIDNRHEYILRKYLNGSENAYINDASVFPKDPDTSEDQHGYEAAYLVFDGQDDYFNMKFNKDLPEEDNVLFDPLQSYLASAEKEEEEAAAAAVSGGASADGDWFVMLPVFIQELIAFIASLVTGPVWKDSCGASEEFGEEVEKLMSDMGIEEAQAALDLYTLELTPHKDIVATQEELTITATGYDENGNILSKNSNPGLIEIKVYQDEEDKIFEFTDTNVKILSSGSTVFTFKATEISGSAAFTASSETVTSAPVVVGVTSRQVQLISSLYSEIEGMKEVKAEIAAAEEAAKSEELAAKEAAEKAAEEAAEKATEEATEKAAEKAADEAAEEADDEADDEREDLGEEDDTSDDLADKISEIISLEKSDTSETEEPISEADEEEDTKGKILVSEPVDESTLKSEPVDETTLRSQPVDLDGDGIPDGIPVDLDGDGVIDGYYESWEDYAVYSGFYNQFIDSSDNVKTWEDYAIYSGFYDQFASSSENDKESSRTLLASAFSSRLITYIPDDENPFVDARKNEDSNYFVYQGSSMVANGESLMEIIAEVKDEDGKLILDEDLTVKFSIEDVDVKIPVEEIITFENGDTAVTESARATVYLRAGTKIGRFKIKALVIDSDNSYPIGEKFIDLIPGPVDSIDLETDTEILVANNQSKANLKITLKDKFDNLAYNSFSDVVLFIDQEDEILNLEEGKDSNNKLIGTQVSISEGVGDIQLLSTDIIGEATLFVVLLDAELKDKLYENNDDWSAIKDDLKGSRQDFTIVDKVDLEINLYDKNDNPIESIYADGESIARIGIKILYDGQVLDANHGNYNGLINFVLLGQSYGNFSQDIPSNMYRGELIPANVNFRSSTLAGEVEVLVDVPGFVSDSIKFDVLPGAPVKFAIDSDSESIYTGGENTALINTYLLDENDNLVDTDNNSVIKFASTDATKDFINFSDKSVKSEKGISKTAITANDISGTANIIVDSDGLETEIFSIDVTKHLTYEDVSKFSPRALYISLLGGSFGNLTKKNNLAQTLLLNDGQVQAVSSVTSSADGFKRLIDIDGYGRILTMSKAVGTTVVPATSSFPYQKLLFSDVLDQKEIIEIFLVPKAGLDLTLLGEEEEEEEEEEEFALIPIPDEEAIYVQSLLEDNLLNEFVEEDGEISIKKSDTTKVRIDKFGRIYLNGDSFGIRLPTPEDQINNNQFALVITEDEENLALVTYNQDFGEGLTALEYDDDSSAFSPGLYVKSKSSTPKYNLEASFSRYSTSDPKGYYLVDTESKINLKHSPGFGYQSLESAQNNFGLGFEGDNKHMLLFAAGNSVGESHIPYASEVGIIYGDPMIKLEVEDDLIGDISHFTKDLGKPLYTGNETIIEMLDFDYNGDGLDDLLLIYEDGLIRLLQNEISNKRFVDRGYVLNISGDIFSTAKIDLNNDGYDDLIVGTKDSCREGEECVTQLTNFKGDFVRKTLNLALGGNKLLEMKTGDINADGCEDLAVADSGGNILIFYNKVDDDQCVGLDTNHGYKKSFGYKIDETVDQLSHLFVYYEGMEEPNEGELEYQLNNNKDDNGNGIIDDESNLHNYIPFTFRVSDPPEGDATCADGGDNDMNKKIDAQDDSCYDSSGNYDPSLSENSAASNVDEFYEMMAGSDTFSDAALPKRTYAKEFNFIHLKADDKLGVAIEGKYQSGKKSIDRNGGNLALGDEIEYKITIKNDSAKNIDDLWLSDSTPSSMSLNEDSLKCHSTSCSIKEIVFEKTGMNYRSHVIKNIYIPAGGTVVMSYTMNADLVPEIHFDIGNDFAEWPGEQLWNGQTGAIDDPYMDFLIRPEVNPEGVLRHLYSNGVDSKGHVKFKTYNFVPPSISTAEFLGKVAEDLGMPKPEKMAENKPPPYVEDEDYATDDVPPMDPRVEANMEELMASQNYNSDFIGCAMDAVNGALDAVGDQLEAAAEFAEGISDVLQAFRCDGGGCLPVPWNHAFFAADGAIPGIPMLSIYPTYAPALGIPMILPFMPSIDPLTSQVRIYLSPTLSMGLAMAVCVGPGWSMVSPCFVFALPGGIPGVCDLVEGLIQGVADAVKDATQAVVDTVSGNTGIIVVGDEASVDLGDDFGKEPYALSTNFNVKVPGFPSVITNWFDKQIDEIMNKLLHLPTLYFLYPDFSPLFTVDEGDKVDVINLKTFMAWVSSVPIVQIEGKTVLLNIPWITQEELLKYEYQGRYALAHYAKEIEKLKVWKCDEEKTQEELCSDLSSNLGGAAIDPSACTTPLERQTLCEIIKADAEEMVSAINDFMSLIDELLILPQKILDYRYIEAKYASQIICYLDAIINSSIGWVLKQIKIVQAWVQAIQKIINAIKNWKMIIDLMLEYQESCDECKSDRFSLLGLLMQLFVVIPEPPVIPIPKWPDIIVDLSQVRTGLKILWPDIKFQIYPIKLPNIPLITFPDLLPQINIEFPEINIPDLPILKLPELPDLPPLPVPEWPDLPRPPIIPDLPKIVVQLLMSLKPIIKILCLIKKALIPIPENQLNTEMSTLTQPSVKILLPILVNLAIEWPVIEYEFVRKIKITGKTSFEVGFDYIHTVVDKAAGKYNKAVKEIVDTINKYTSYPYDKLISKIIDEAYQDFLKELGLDEINIEISGDGIKVEGFGLDEDEDKDEEVDKVFEVPEDEDPEGEDPEDENPEGEDPEGNPISYIDETQQKELEKILAMPEIKELHSNIENFSKTITDFVDNLEDQDYPEAFYLTATQTYLDPSHPILNRSIAEVEESIKTEELPDLPFIKRLADVRSELIAYTKGLNKTNAVLESIDDYNEFMKILVDSDKSLDRVASLTTPSTERYSNGKIQEMDFFGPAAQELLLDTAKELERDLIAVNIDFQQGAADLASGSDDSSLPVPVGFFIAVGEDSENVLYYTSDLDKNTKMLFNDVDDDGDYDIIYSMLGSVYWKESHQVENPVVLPKGKILDPGFAFGTEISDYVNPGGTSVEGLKVPYSATGKADINWLKKLLNIDNDVAGYEIILRTSLLDDLDDYEYRYLALTNSLSDEISTELISEMDIDEEFIFEINKESPLVGIEDIENDYYYVDVFSIDKNYNKSLPSSTQILASHVCDDEEAPYPLVQSTELSVSIFKNIEIDASSSFDVEGEVVEYFLEVLDYEATETDPKTDQPLRTTTLKNIHKVTYDDREMNILYNDLEPKIDNLDCYEEYDEVVSNDRTDPVFNIGPYENEGDIGKHEFILHVLDTACQDSELNITVDVFAPEISLADVFSRTGVARGKTTPLTSEIPFSLMRNRYVYRVIDQELKLAPRFSKVLDGITLQNGDYEISDFELENMILVENSEGDVIAEIHPTTGNIGKIQDGYSTVVSETKFPDIPISVDIVNSDGEALGYVYLVADPNIDVTLHEELGFNAESTEGFIGVHIDDLNMKDYFYFIILPADDPNHPGGAVLVSAEEKRSLAVIDSAGNTILWDDRITMTHKENDHLTDPLIITIHLDDLEIADLYISGLSYGDFAQLVGPKDVPFESPDTVSAYTMYSTFSDLFNDLDDELKGLVTDMYQKGVIDAEQTDTGLSLDPGEFVTRQEFIKGLLKLLCIIPRPEAYEPFKSGIGYYDITYDENNEFQPYIHEATLLGLIEGYKGERDPENGLTPYKPLAIINKAESVKIILEALEMQEVIDLATVKEVIPWYAEYIDASLDINPYLISEEIVDNNFILTEEEAADPEAFMTFATLMLISTRVLNFYNCFEIDADDDGMPDYCEEKYGIDDPEGDEDNDYLLNKDECYYGLDPTNEDTDGGGELDGIEVALGTNGLNPTDDPRDDDGDGLTNRAEELIHGTDPYIFDTDGGGVDDGTEVKQCTDVLDVTDDLLVGCSDAENGIYIVPAECNTCPCISTFLHKADIVPGDLFFTAILKEYDDYYEVEEKNEAKEKVYIFSKNDEVMIEKVPGVESLDNALSGSI